MEDRVSTMCNVIMLYRTVSIATLRCDINQSVSYVTCLPGLPDVVVHYGNLSVQIFIR